MGTILEDLDAMSNALNADGTDAPSTESVVTKAPGTEAPTTEVPEEFKTNAPSTEVSATEAPTTEAPNEIALLRAEIELLKEGKKEDPKTTKAPSTDAPYSEEDFLGTMDLDELTRDPKQFNKLLNTIYKKAIDTARGEVRSGNENILKSIPDIVKNNVTVIASLKKASEEFYEENKDLVPFKKVVAAVFEEIAAENPDKSYIDNLKVVGEEVRKRLELKKVAIAKEKENNKGPKLPRSKGNQRPNNKPELSGIMADLAAMDQALDE